MRARSVWSVLFVLISAAGCGGGSSGATVACTSGTGTSQSCFEIYASNAAGSGAAAAKMDCTNSGGVASDMCSHAGADGGCKTDVSQGGVTASLTTWYCSGNAASEMQACTSNGDTWIAP